MNWPLILTAMLPSTCCSPGCSRSSASRSGTGARATASPLRCSRWRPPQLGTLALRHRLRRHAVPGHFSVIRRPPCRRPCLLALALPVLLISRDDFAETPYYTLVLASLYGACLVISSDSFPTLFLASRSCRCRSTRWWCSHGAHPERGGCTQYLVLGGAATATLLMGIAFLYGWSGSLRDRRVLQRRSPRPTRWPSQESRS